MGENHVDCWAVSFTRRTIGATIELFEENAGWFESFSHTINPNRMHWNSFSRTILPCIPRPKNARVSKICVQTISINFADTWNRKVCPNNRKPKLFQRFPRLIQTFVRTVHRKRSKISSEIKFCRTVLVHSIQPHSSEPLLFTWYSHCSAPGLPWLQILFVPLSYFYHGE